jgi:hypothetical protein
VWLSSWCETRFIWLYEQHFKRLNFVFWAWSAFTQLRCASFWKSFLNAAFYLLMFLQGYCPANMSYTFTGARVQGMGHPHNSSGYYQCPPGEIWNHTRSRISGSFTCYAGLGIYPRLMAGPCIAAPGLLTTISSPSLSKDYIFVYFSHWYAIYVSSTAEWRQT